MAVATQSAEPSVAIEFAKQAERLGHRDDSNFTKFSQRPKVFNHGKDSDDDDGTKAVEAKFITGQDPVIVTANGERLPAVPVDEALKLNELKDKIEGRPAESPRQPLVVGGVREAKDGSVHGAQPTSLQRQREHSDPEKPDSVLRDATPQSMTNPLFPPLPLYGPPSLARAVQCCTFRCSAAILSFLFLLVIILGSLFTTAPLILRYIWMLLTIRDPDSRRPFYSEEKARAKERRQQEAAWVRNDKSADVSDIEFPPLEGGPDRLVCDARYYARRVGLELEEFDVQTEDGFIITLWHVFDPNDYVPAKPEMRRAKSANVFREGFAEHGRAHGASGSQYPDGRKKYPVLLMHGLLQSAGAFCCSDDNSLAFFLAKSGYDVWLGNNRCGFHPRHTLLSYADPRMWAWNIRQMGVMDLSALVSRVLEETGFEKLGLVCHSQGTTQTFVALAKEQRADLGKQISVFCALAPAAYAGPLIRKAQFKFMQVISPGLFRMVFGIHAFIPFMMTMHRVLPAKLYGAMGYRVFSFLFNWSDDRWEKDLRDRFFQFSPTYVSAESMRWWLGRECFAKHKCILSTRTEGQLEDEEDEEEDEFFAETSKSQRPRRKTTAELPCDAERHHHADHGRYAWYSKDTPPFAFWIAGNDALVDGRRLLRRFERGREPHVCLVHSKIIEGYEHLDVIWAMDSIEQVGTEVRDVIWRTASPEAKLVCRTPKGV